MPTIRKRDGTTEQFDAEKIKNSLADASDAIRQSLSTGALDGILRELEDMLEGKEEASSRQIYVMLIGILCERGYFDILREYMRYSENAFRRGDA